MASIKAIRHVLNTQAFERRFLDKVSRTPNGCWAWMGALANKGYGKLTIEKRTYRANRIAYEMFCGPIPDDLFVLHRCDNPPCVNPAHLFIGDTLANWKDMVGKGRDVAGGLFVKPENRTRGERSPLTKLTLDQVRAIRAEYVPHIVTHKALAKKYRVHKDTIRYVLTGRTWTE